MHQIKSDGNVFKNFLKSHHQVLIIYIYKLLQFIGKKINTEIKSARSDENLLFVKERFEDILTNLERWYDAEIIPEDKKPGEYTLKETFLMEGFKKDINVLKLTVPFEYSIDKIKTHYCRNDKMKFMF